MKITVRDGELYGALIDILRNSAPLMLVALGMTLVIATRGIDLSVGAVMAVSGAVALTIIDGSSSPGSTGTVLVAIAVGVGVALRARRLERLPGRRARHPADHRDARAHARRARGRAADHRRLHHDGQQRAAEATSRAATCCRLPFAFFICDRRRSPSSRSFERRTALGVLTEAVGINPEASRLAGVRSRGIIFGAYVASGTLAGIAGIIYSSNIMAADANAAGDLHRALRDPRGRARRHLAHGRQVHDRGHRHRRPHHPDAQVDDPLPRGLLGAEPGVLRGRRDHRGADPVAARAPHGARSHRRHAVARNAPTRPDAEVAA